MKWLLWHFGTLALTEKAKVEQLGSPNQLKSASQFSLSGGSLSPSKVTSVFMKILIFNLCAHTFLFGEKMREKVVGYYQALCWVRLLLSQVKPKDDPQAALDKLAAEVDSALETITLGAGADFKTDMETQIKIQ